jgi:hypothetical protein
MEYTVAMLTEQGSLEGRRKRRRQQSISSQVVPFPPRNPLNTKTEQGSRTAQRREPKKIRFCGGYHKSFLPIDKFSKEAVVGCDSCRKLDAKYAQKAKAKKRKAEQEKEQQRKKQCSEGTKNETGVQFNMTDVESSFNSGNQNHGELSTFSNSHCELVILDWGVL